MDRQNQEEENFGENVNNADLRTVNTNPIYNDEDVLFHNINDYVSQINSIVQSWKLKIGCLWEIIHIELKICQYSCKGVSDPHINNSS